MALCILSRSFWNLVWKSCLLTRAVDNQSAAQVLRAVQIAHAAALLDGAGSSLFQTLVRTSVQSPRRLDRRGRVRCNVADNPPSHRLGRR